MRKKLLKLGFAALLAVPTLAPRAVQADVCPDTYFMFDRGTVITCTRYVLDPNDPCCRYLSDQAPVCIDICPNGS